jgi:DNA modification methylase
VKLLFALRPDAAGLTDENEVPECTETAASAAGDIWMLGLHRIACGDSTDADLVKALLSGDVPKLMVTDPPYGVRYDPSARLGDSKSIKRGRIKNDDRADWSATWALFPGEVAYVWHAALHSVTVAESLFKTGFTIRSQIIWAKERLVLSRADYHWMHEVCWYSVRQVANWTGDRKQTTLWTIPTGGQDERTKHATQKPVECMRRPILNNSSVGDAVYEPFLGSGTTLIAAESAGRICFGIEIDPAFVDVAIKRWQSFSGQRAKRRRDGANFDDVVGQAAGLACKGSGIIPDQREVTK